MRWLITGGAGFIGSHLCEHLLRQGDHVIAIDDLSTGREGNVSRFEVSSNYGNRWELEIADARDITPAFMRGIDHVVHLAAVVGVSRVLKHPLETMRVNMEATTAVLEAAAQERTPVLLASTSEVYAQNTPPFRETDNLVLGPSHVRRWGYAVSKLADEHLALAYHQQWRLPVRIVRLFNTVGPRQLANYGMVLPRFVEAALRGHPLPVYGDGNQQRCFTHVKDVVRAIEELALCPAAVGEIVNVGSTEAITIRDLAQRVLNRTGSTSSITHIPYSELGDGYADSQARQPDVSKLESLTGWHPVRMLDQIIDDVIDWKKATG